MQVNFTTWITGWGNHRQICPFTANRNKQRKMKQWLIALDRTLVHSLHFIFHSWNFLTCAFHFRIVAFSHGRKKTWNLPRSAESLWRKRGIEIFVYSVQSIQWDLPPGVELKTFNRIDWQTPSTILIMEKKEKRLTPFLLSCFSKSA